jgi:hypothetical protein
MALQCSVRRCRKTAHCRADYINSYTPTSEGPRPYIDQSGVVARLHAVERTTSIATHRLLKAPRPYSALSGVVARPHAVERTTSIAEHRLMNYPGSAIVFYLSTLSIIIIIIIIII